MKLLDLPFLADITAIRRDIHAHPELAYQETRTSDIVAAKLAEWGLEVTRGLGKTGVVVIDSKTNKKNGEDIIKAISTVTPHTIRMTLQGIALMAFCSSQVCNRMSATATTSGPHTL